SDEEATVEAAKQIAPEFVLTVPIGRYLTTIGAVNDALGLPGISREMAVLCTDKYAFHQALNGRGLRDCRCYRVWADEENVCVISDGEKQYGIAELEIIAAEGRIEEIVSFPAILKPRYGSGSRGIHFLNDGQQLLAALPEVAGEEYVLEECALGDEYGVDGAVIDGKFYMVLLRKKENTPPPARQAVGYFSVQPTDAFYQQVKEYLEQVVSCLGLEECLFHADLIRSEAGPFAIELSARPSGHNLHNLFTSLCTGVDMAEEYMKYRLGQAYSFVPAKTRSMLIHYFDMEGRISHVPEREEVMQAVGGSLIEWKCDISVGDILTPVSDGHSVMGRGFFVLEATADEGTENPAACEEALKKKAEAVKALFFA
ncbi:MAG: ATP-grasp domain-containing protein, partial [Lachnospiraceae bacterium]|nr:ATP-grasp domain-containing protein [Lachnospiraceae bacterium]